MASFLLPYRIFLGFVGCLPGLRPDILRGGLDRRRLAHLQMNRSSSTFEGRSGRPPGKAHLHKQARGEEQTRCSSPVTLTLPRLELRSFSTIWPDMLGHERLWESNRGRRYRLAYTIGFVLTEDTLDFQ